MNAPISDCPPGYTPGPCTQEARDEGCICRMSSVNSASIDPPYGVIDLNCPLHGNEAARDPDTAYEKRRDDAVDDTVDDDWRCF